MTRPYPLIAIFALAVLVAGCSSSSTPQMIASYPKNQVNPQEGAPYVPSAYTIVYDAYLILEVANPEKSASRAVDLAYEYGGYLSSSQTWYQDGSAYVTVVLAVPSSSFDRLHGRLLDLGTALSDEVSSRLVEYPTPGWAEYSQINVKFQPRILYKPAINPHTWRPIRTLERAFGVSLSILSFLVDVLIWVTVVVGPFALIAWGASKMIKRQK